MLRKGKATEAKMKNSLMPRKDVLAKRKEPKTTRLAVPGRRKS
jgi:hypothetical protein